MRAVARLSVTPHVARKRSTAPSTAAPHAIPAYPPSASYRRKPVEEIFGWLKTVGGLRKTRHRGLARVGWIVSPSRLAAYNLVRMRNLLAAPNIE